MKVIAIMMSVVLLLAGCGAQQIANTKQLDEAASKLAGNSGLTPEQVCEQAGVSISQGDAAELRFYAPLHIKQSIDNFEQGQKEIKKPETTALGVQKCYKSSQLITNGMEIKIKAKDMLKDALAEYDMLKQVDSSKKYADDIQDHREDIQDLIKNIEAGKINEALKGQADLLKEMQSLEIEIVLYNNLAPVEAMVEKADDANADDLAEKTFEKAEAELASAKKFITANYRNNDEVKATAALAMRAVQHAFYVANEVETLKELKPEKAEEKVLYIESLFENVNKKFNQDVVIGHSLYEQADMIGKRLDAVLDTNVSLDKELVLMKQQAITTPLPVAEPDTTTPLEPEPAVVSEENVTPVQADTPVASEDGQAAAAEVPSIVVEDEHVAATDQAPVIQSQ